MIGCPGFATWAVPHWKLSSEAREAFTDWVAAEIGDRVIDVPSSSFGATRRAVFEESLGHIWWFVYGIDSGSGAEEPWSDVVREYLDCRRAAIGGGCILWDGGEVYSGREWRLWRPTWTDPWRVVRARVELRGRKR